MAELFSTPKQTQQAVEYTFLGTFFVPFCRPHSFPEGFKFPVLPRNKHSIPSIHAISLQISLMFVGQVHRAVCGWEGDGREDDRVDETEARRQWTSRVSDLCAVPCVHGPHHSHQPLPQSRWHQALRVSPVRGCVHAPAQPQLSPPHPLEQDTVHVYRLRSQVPTPVTLQGTPETTHRWSSVWVRRLRYQVDELCVQWLLTVEFMENNIIYHT